MISKVRPNGRQPNSAKEDVESLYLAFLQKFYESGNRVQARKLAVRLEVYWLPVKRSVVDLGIESRLSLVESMSFVRLDF